ncbi:hypothetical protein [Parahaliea mediterranea]|uniref:DUF4412 domain-containing protein n=1 Tax=Parahaliea mediterranea TaxID=651086 RepID=A0A939DFB7_9GAMM|nr:hypothetical protein [Parahaliea mediterranea]MBN7797068.1 hypothetical protein [Parahaliea mediterranea]
MRVKSILIGAVFTLSATFQAWADGVVTVASGGESMRVEFTDGGMMRMEDPSGQGYMLMREGSLYSVVSDGGNIMVIDIAQAISTMGDAWQQGAFWDTDIQEIASIESTGKSETVAGIKGEVYEMRAVDNSGRTTTSTMVLTRHEDVAAFTRAMFGMTGILLSALGEQQAGALGEAEAFVNDGGWGVLRQGDEYSITQVKSVKPDAARFALPAEPMQLPSLGDFTGGRQGRGEAEADDETGGGGLADFFKRKTERQQDRAEGKADRAVDRATDKAVDNVVDSVLDRLF